MTDLITTNVSRKETDARIKALARKAGEPWERIEPKGWVDTPFTEYPVLPCDPCFGAVGPYPAYWHNPDTGMYRCTGCLEYALEHKGTTAHECEGT